MTGSSQDARGAQDAKDLPVLASKKHIRSSEEYCVLVTKAGISDFGQSRGSHCNLAAMDTAPAPAYSDPFQGVPVKDPVSAPLIPEMNALREWED
eukprot:Skav220908  [mRNA]  locus=scaffold1585:48657:56673:- [translate_table: standard]